MKIFAITIVLIVAAIACYFFFFNGASDTLQETVIEDSGPGLEEPDQHENPVTKITQPLSAEQTQTFGLEPIPPLEESDPYLAKLITEKSPWAPLLNLKEKVRTIVVAIDRLSQDQNPNSQLSFLKPKESLKIRTKTDRVFLAPENYTRYSPLTSLFDQIDPTYAAVAYQHLFPLFDEAYQELGNGDDALAKKISLVMEKISGFSYPPGEIELAGKDGLYIFVDTALEKATPLEKALIRMGPENTHLLQIKIQEFQQELEKLQPR